MKDIHNIKHIYFIGIGGIGMSAIARYFHSLGKTVAGYDKTETNLTKALTNSGIEIIYNDLPEQLPDWLKSPSDDTLCVYTPAVPSSLAILRHAHQQFETIKRSEALARITENKFTIAVAGTHGKTTTSTYLAYLLASENRNVTAFLGGISANFNSNYIRHKGNGEEIVVVEADEYDRSFLRLSPNISIITSCEPDHLDIYGDYAHLKETYNQFANKLTPAGSLILHESLKQSFDLRDDISSATYGREADIRATEIEVEDGHFTFSLDKLALKKLVNGMPGEHNVLNATAAIIATYLAATIDNVKKALPKFKGIRRRFETIYQSKEIVYIDDYAHHPSELQAAISTARQLFPEKKLTVVFQPHLYSRTRDFAQEFTHVLTTADELIIMPIYPAREEPIRGVDSNMLIKSKGVIMSHDEILDHFSQNAPEVLLTLGAGNIDLLVEPLKILFTQKETYA